MSYGPKIVREIQRTDADSVRALGDLGTATVHEAYRRRGLLSGIRQIVPATRMAGTAVTCLNYPADNLMLQAAIEVCRPGDVLIVAVTAPSQHGMLGDLLATSCKARGLAGVVLDSGVRDVDELRALGLPVFSRGISALGTTKNGFGYVNVPVSCGGVVVYPGDAVVGDTDGVVAVERDAVDETLRQARNRVENEDRLRTALTQGESALDLGDLREHLTVGGAEWV
jgi:4-hydroxy-4-methyl-2-oxoglutarate aldolase